MSDIIVGLPPEKPPMNPVTDDPVNDTLKDGLIFRTLRHPSTEHMGPHFAYGHLPPHLQAISRRFAQLAQFLVDALNDGPELTVALRKLWESKNSAVLHAGFITDKANQKILDQAEARINAQAQHPPIPYMTAPGSSA